MKSYLLNWLPRWFAAGRRRLRVHAELRPRRLVRPPTGVDAPLGSATRFAVPNIIAPSSTAYVAYMAKLAIDSGTRAGREHGRALEAVYEGVKADFNAKWWDASVGYYRENADAAAGAVDADPAAGVRARARRSGGARCRRSSSTTCW